MYHLLSAQPSTLTTSGQKLGTSSNLIDDGNLAAVSSADIKGFVDTSAMVILWARWGGCLFAANQLRVICNNLMNRDADRADLGFFTIEVTHDTCRDLTRPAYNPMMNYEDSLPL